MKQVARICTVLSVICNFQTRLVADPVSPQQARAIVQAWLGLAPRPLGARMSGAIGGVFDQIGPDGSILYYVARLRPAGFVVVAPDDLIGPIVAFSPTGYIDSDPQNPLHDFLAGDMADRVQYARDLESAGSRMEMPAPARNAREAWKFLLRAGITGGSAVAALPSISDPRVDPFVQSRWDQSNVGGLNCYNYYTPNHYVAGCAATAMAQLMRFHQFPIAGIGVHAFAISVDGVAQSANTRGGNGAGGPYDWANMPLIPSSPSDAQRQAIGSLVYDDGLSIYMRYSNTGSASDTLDIANALRFTMGYSNAIAGWNGAGELVGHGLYQMVNPNLDAGLPVDLGITGSAGGHAIVCDGYGYSSGTMYHHLNMGWSGASDAWYDLPNIGTAYNFTKVYKCIYNVFVTGGGEILSGRVTDASGNPLSGATVAAGPYTDTTDARGIYALVHVAPGSYTVTAAKPGYNFTAQTNRVVGTSVTMSTTVGNLWGVNFTDGICVPASIANPPQGQTILTGQAAALNVLGSGTSSLHYAWYQGSSGDASHPVGTDSSSYTTPALVASTSYWVRVSNGCGLADSAAATINVSGTCTAPGIATQPQGVTLPSGQSTTVSVAATGVGPLHYQWYEGASGDTHGPVGADASVFTTPALLASTSYWVRVANGCGTADSAAAAVTVTGGCSDCPAITGIASKTGKPGSLATIRGTHFTSDKKKIQVYFGTKVAAVSRATSTTLRVTIPRRLPSGAVDVRVLVNGAASNTFVFQVK